MIGISLASHSTLCTRQCCTGPLAIGLDTTASSTSMSFVLRHLEHVGLQLARYVIPEGFFELLEIDWCPRCSAAPDPDDRSVFDEWYSGMVEASEEIGLPIAYRGDTDILLRRAGFEVEEHLTIPLVCCCGPRERYSPNEDSDKFKMADDLMSWMRSAMGVDGMGDWPGRWSGFMMELFTRFKGYSQAEVEALDRRLCHAVQRPNCPFYFDL